jgi:S-adenosylmethionine decarboxylase
MKRHGPLANHMLVELRECSSELLDNPVALKELLSEAVRRGGGTIVTDVFHTFNPHGVSGVIVIAESHVAIHTWPEHRYAAVDIFSCGTKLNHALIRDWIAAGMAASDVECRQLTRG